MLLVPAFFFPMKSSPRGPRCRVPTFLTWIKRPLVQSMYWIVPLLGISCPAWGTLYYFLLWAREVRVKSVLTECWFHGQVILVDDRYVIVYRHFVVFAVGTKHVHAYTILKSLYVPFLYFCFFSRYERATVYFQTFILKQNGRLQMLGIQATKKMDTIE